MHAKSTIPGPKSPKKRRVGVSLWKPIVKTFHASYHELWNLNQIAGIARIHVADPVDPDMNYDMKISLTLPSRGVLCSILFDPICGLQHIINFVSSILSRLLFLEKLNLGSRFFCYWYSYMFFPCLIKVTLEVFKHSAFRCIYFCACMCVCIRICIFLE